jgi:hypothetical protein
VSVSTDLDAIDGTDAERQDLLARLDTARKETTAARTQIRSLQADVDRLESVRDFLRTPLATEPRWAKPKRLKSSERRGTIATVLSDLHLDEVVLPSEMGGKNAYSREIAELRLKRYFTNLIEQATYYHQGTMYDGGVMMLAGDTVSGIIHAELRETNDGTLFDTIRFWTPKLKAGLLLLADALGVPWHVMAVPGNHGRLTVKPRFKTRAHDNADWLIGALLAEALADDERFTFDISDGLDSVVKVYDTRILLNHGETGGGQGIGGIFPPIMRLRARKRASTEFDWFVIGHWHQYLHARGLTVNGSLKGWDEFAVGKAFEYEEPRQAMFIITPEHGTTWPIEILVQNRREEGW